MKNILIIKHGSLGDIVLSIYPIFSIKEKYKNSKVTILTEAKYQDLFKFIPFIDNIKVDNRNKLIDLFFLVKLCIWFYKQKFDWVFDLQTSKRTTIYFYIFSLFSRFKWSGIAKGCSHPHLSKKRKTLHTFERQRDQLRLAGIKKFATVNWSFLKSDISKLDLSDDLFLLVIGGSIHRPKKRWTLKNYIKIIEELNKFKIVPIIIGGNDEKRYMNDKRLRKVNYKDLVGKTDYFTLAEIARKSKCILGNDTGPMHLLVQCSKRKTKKIVLFGDESNPELCAPIGKNVIIVKKKNINDILPEEIMMIMDLKKR